ncbi:MAG: hypothetical protein WC299_12520 [Kiritimatiellia bacterium]
MKALGLCGMMLALCGAQPATGAAAGPGQVRMFTSEPACFEFLFTGVSDSADGKQVLSFNHRNDRTYFVRVGEQLGPYRVAAFEQKTEKVFMPSLNASLDRPAGRAVLSGPGNETLVLEQNKPLPWPGRTAWLVKLDNGAWWNANELDVFSVSNTLVFVEEIDEGGMVVTAGDDLAFIPVITAAEKEALKNIWAEKKREALMQEQLARVRFEEEEKARARESPPKTTFVYLQRPVNQVEIRGAPRIFYGTEFPFPTAFKVCPGAYTVDGRFIAAPFVLPCSFRTYRCGMSINVP